MDLVSEKIITFIPRLINEDLCALYDKCSAEL